MYAFCNCIWTLKLCYISRLLSSDGLVAEVNSHSYVIAVILARVFVKSVLLFPSDLAIDFKQIRGKMSLRCGNEEKNACFDNSSCI